MKSIFFVFALAAAAAGCVGGKTVRQSAPPPSHTPADFGRPEVFVPQKARAKKRLVLLAGAFAALFVLGVICTAVHWFAP